MFTAEKILDFITKNRQATGKELSDYFSEITPRAVRKQLKNLYDKKLLRKIGHPPKVYYLLESQKENFTIEDIDKKTQSLINERYLFISPAGQSILGWKGFLAWCEKTKQDPEKTANEYVATLKKFDKFRKNNFIDGMPKMEKTFKNVFLDKLFYLDFYSIERFGKTKLGQMLLYAKQSQNLSLIHQLIKEIRPQVISIITRYSDRKTECQIYVLNLIRKKLVIC
ncbi:MAG TPA: hypothetical protein VNW29_03030 [Candidatus Sulfotelmatobacter sp.]|nr:hypothetical protein [Candidatus Sulfotelmatobacter sp.]